MSVPVKLTDDLYMQAKLCGKIHNRSIPKQIEFWAKIGHIAEDNPDLTYDMIIGILVGVQEAETGILSEYKFSR
ncbi:MAG: hypothetical protein WCG04_02450 [Alphaproteobacteria bacterium]